MKKLILISALLFSLNGWTYNQTDLSRIKPFSTCQFCDLSGADLTDADLIGVKLFNAYIDNANLVNANLNGANLPGADLTTTSLKDANLDGVKFCKTQMPWGEVNDNC